MSRVEIYSHPGCGYCHQAKRLLNDRSIPFEEWDISRDSRLVTDMVRRTGGRTLPQILINDKAIGGFDQLRQLDVNDELQALLTEQ
jgi:glutaredoxin 3